MAHENCTKYLLWVLRGRQSPKQTPPILGILYVLKAATYLHKGFYIFWLDIDFLFKGSKIPGLDFEKGLNLFLYLQTSAGQKSLPLSWDAFGVHNMPRVSGPSMDSG